jgi:hypothetical integral membrane protein (TIGR02206 family)
MTLFFAFQLFGSSHLAVLATMLIAPMLLALLARMSGSARTAQLFAWLLAAIAIVSKIATYVFASINGELDARDSLPMHLCDWAGVAAVVALIARGQIAYELAYFWGLAGTLQAMITPDLKYDFPDSRAFTFFINHGVIISAVIFLTFGARMRPWPKSIVRVFAISQIYVLAACAVDYLLNENYGYFRAKPEHASLMDHLGPWPVYAILLEPLALVSFCIYYAPFFAADKLTGKKSNVSF